MIGWSGRSWTYSSKWADGRARQKSVGDIVGANDRVVTSLSWNKHLHVNISVGTFEVFHSILIVYKRQWIRHRAEKNSPKKHPLNKNTEIPCRKNATVLCLMRTSVCLAIWFFRICEANFSLVVLEPARTMRIIPRSDGGCRSSSWKTNASYLCVLT